MLQLKGIIKNYGSGDQAVNALKNINLKFRSNEFVSVLGPSGCGKTTLLNIIGGLDRYTSGDLLINNKSTKNFKDKNWDSYRNSTIGFVFQNYNLISHLTVLDNVEIALILSGFSAKVRKERAIKVIEVVGLKAKIKKARRHKMPACFLVYSPINDYARQLHLQAHVCLQPDAECALVVPESSSTHHRQ